MKYVSLISDGLTLTVDERLGLWIKGLNLGIGLGQLIAPCAHPCYPLYETFDVKNQRSLCHVSSELFQVVIDAEE